MRSQSITRHARARGIFAFAAFCGVALCATLLCRAAGALPVHPQHQKRVSRQTVEAMEEQWRLAQLNGDANAMDRLLSDDFVGITAFGQVETKAQQLARLRDRSLVLSQLDLTDVKVKLIGPIVAVVTSRAELKGTSGGLPVGGSFRYTRVYQRLASGMWKITSFEATRTRPESASGPGSNPKPHPDADASASTQP